MNSEHIKEACLAKATAAILNGQRHTKKPPTAKEIIAYAKELEKYVTK